MTTTTRTREGGCLCGAVRYRIEAEPEDVAYCHCRMCQKASGAPVVVWGSVPAAAFAWTRGRPEGFRSSDRAGRLFCPDCGSQLVFKVVGEPDRIDVSVATLDDAADVVPAYHIWAASRQPWFDARDDLPRHPEERAAGPAPASAEPPPPEAAVVAHDEAPAAEAASPGPEADPALDGTADPGDDPGHGPDHHDHGHHHHEDGGGDGGPDRPEVRPGRAAAAAG